MTITTGQPVNYLMINKEYEKPISFSPTLARVFGIDAAIFLQWLHYFMVVKCLQERPTQDGRMWVYNSYEEWHSHMSFLSLTGVTSAIRKLEALGVILSAQMGANKFDRRKSYTIDYERLSALTHIPRAMIFAQNGTPVESVTGAIPVNMPVTAATPTTVIAPPAADALSATLRVMPEKPLAVMVEAAMVEAAAVVAPTPQIATPAAPEPSADPNVSPLNGAAPAANPMPAERRVLVERNRRLKSLDEATPADFERLGLPDLRHIEAGLRPFSYSIVVMGMCPVPSNYYAHVEEVCQRLNVPYQRPDIEPHVVLPCYTDSTTNSTIPNSSPDASAHFSAVATAPAPMPTVQGQPPEKGGHLPAEELNLPVIEQGTEQGAAVGGNPPAPKGPASVASMVTALCMVCYPGGEVSVQLKSDKTKQELTRAAEDILRQTPETRPEDLRLWPAFQHVMGWRYLTPGFVVQHWAEYRRYLENPSRFVVKLPSRMKKPDPFTHLREEFVLDIPVED